MRVSAQKGTITVGMSSSNGAGISPVIFSEAKVKDFVEFRGGKGERVKRKGSNESNKGNRNQNKKKRVR
jgi:hypothetical protein